MNVFQITKEIRDVGHNYGRPMWVVEFGLGASYSMIDLINKLISTGMPDRSWLLLRNGMDERGLGVLVDALTRVGCRVEVEAYGRHTTPGWFTKATTWTVMWDDREVFNFTALRKGQDMLICKELNNSINALVESDVIDVGLLSNKCSADEMIYKKIRIYPYREVVDC